MHLHDAVLAAELAAGKLEWLQDGQNLLDAWNGGQRLHLQFILVADHADDGAQLALAQMRSIAKLLNAFQDVVELLLAGIGPDDDDHVISERLGDSGDASLDEVTFVDITLRVLFQHRRSAREPGDRIGAQNRQHLTVLLQRGKGFLDLGIFVVAIEIDEKHRFGPWRTGRERFDPAHIQLVGLEGAECIDEAAGMICQTEHDGSLVVAGLRTFLVADDGEARLVGVGIFNIAEQHSQTVPDRRLPAGNGRSARLTLRQLRLLSLYWRLRVARHAARFC